MKKICVLALFIAAAVSKVEGQEPVNVIVQTIREDYEVSIRETCGFLSIDDYGMTFFINGMFNNDTLTVKTVSIGGDTSDKLRFSDGSRLSTAKYGNGEREAVIVDINPENTEFVGIRAIFFEEPCSRFFDLR